MIYMFFYLKQTLSNKTLLLETVNKVQIKLATVLIKKYNQFMEGTKIGPATRKGNRARTALTIFLCECNSTEAVRHESECSCSTV